MCVRPSLIIDLFLAWVSPLNFEATFATCKSKKQEIKRTGFAGHAFSDSADDRSPAYRPFRFALPFAIESSLRPRQSSPSACVRVCVGCCDDTLSHTHAHLRRVVEKWKRHKLQFMRNLKIRFLFSLSRLGARLNRPAPCHLL